MPKYIEKYIYTHTHSALDSPDLNFLDKIWGSAITGDMPNHSQKSKLEVIAMSGSYRT